MIDTKILAEAMKKSGKKQYELAEHFGVNKSTISTNLRRDNMSLDVFVKYLNAMGYTVMVGTKADETFVPEWEVESGK